MIYKYRFWILFGVFCLVNTYVLWTEPLWLHPVPFFDAEIWINPFIDNLMAHTALLFVLFQAPGGLLIDFIEKYMQLNKVAGLLILSMFSAITYYLIWQLMTIILNALKRKKRTL